MRSMDLIGLAVRISPAFSMLLAGALRHNRTESIHRDGGVRSTIVQALRQQFIEFALQAGVLRFGEFRTKAGRLSPYFFNAGLFNRGALLGRLARFYAQTLLAARAEGRVQFDMLFGPAYKGITLAAGTAMALADLGTDVPFAYNRKERRTMARAA